MMISQQQFNTLTEQEQKEYLYFWSALHEARSEKQAIEFTEKNIAMYRSGLTGLARTKVEADLSNHIRYQGILEDISRYELRVRNILDKLEDVEKKNNKVEKEIIKYKAEIHGSNCVFNNIYRKTIESAIKSARATIDKEQTIQSRPDNHKNINIVIFAGTVQSTPEFKKKESVFYHQILKVPYIEG